MVKILPRRSHRRARFLIIIGVIFLIFSFIILFWIAQDANRHSLLPSGLRILCGIDLLVLITSVVALFWGLSIWFRDKFC